MKVGRPKLPDDKRRDLTIKIRVNAEEKAIITKLARSIGMPASELVRRLVMHTALKRLVEDSQ